jgi:hypothetical protein
LHILSENEGESAHASKKGQGAVLELRERGIVDNLHLCHNFAVGDFGSEIVSYAKAVQVLMLRMKSITPAGRCRVGGTGGSVRLSKRQKVDLTRRLVNCLKDEKEVTKIVIFGSFLRTNEPEDIDVAVFQESIESYITLALRDRKRARPVSRIIPLDLIPVTANASADDPFLSEILQGEVVHER